ncbi:MAG: tetratricopeptide repeat protein [Cypionkella sp.]|jgi:tetratricopeptide (TPR) repeat protein
MPHILAYVLIALVGLVSVSLDPIYAAGTEDDVVETEGVADYDKAKALIKEKEDYAAALPILEALTEAQPDYADAWNLRGFANRKLGNMEAAATAYDTALTLNPEHLGALEYQGEMFIQTGKMEEALANLVKLQSICGDCEQAQDLQKALAAVKS